ncbi:MAG: TIGR02530 family flagellar biosynthesis protein [Halanaerobiales bacterium]
MSNPLFVNNSIRPVRPGNNDSKNTRQVANNKGPSFGDILKKKIDQNSPIKFSKHAQNRLVSRNINLSNQDLDQLANGVQKAADKGSKDSLVMVNNVAYVVSVENKTVVTAVDDGSMNDKVFTNIDSAVFME